jgi:hypothetical protein
VRVSTRGGPGLRGAVGFATGLAVWLGVAGLPPASAQQSASPTPATVPAATLRCWQDGQLIFERTGLLNLVAEATDRVVLNAAKGDGDEMILLDSGRATCLFERDE